MIQEIIEKVMLTNKGSVYFDTRTSKDFKYSKLVTRSRNVK